MRERMARRWFAVALVATMGCLQVTGDQPPEAPVLSLGDAIGYWVLHASGPPFDAHVDVLRVYAVADSVWPLRVLGLPAISYRGAVIRDFGPDAGYGRVTATSVEARIALAAGDTAVFVYGIGVDTMAGTVQVVGPSGSTPAIAVAGVRVDPALLNSAAQVDSAFDGGLDPTPLVLVRLDDAAATDRDFAQRLRARALVAELAVPIEFVGEPDRLTWAALDSLAAQGFSLAAHSRSHGNSPASTAQFLAEFVGSMNDLAAHGHGTRIFVQPGTWHDSLDFDTWEKLQNWRGSLVRTVTSVFEGYVYRGSQIPIDSVRYGLGQTTISDGATPDYILHQWSSATKPWHATVFMAHTSHVLAPDELDWFLDTLASAQAAGRIRIIRSSEDVFAARSTATLRALLQPHP